jgi:hypothetical protein
MYNFGKLLGLTLLSIAAITMMSTHKAYAAYCDMLVPTSAGSTASNCDKYVNAANTSGVASAGGLISDLQADLSSNVPADKTSAQWIIDQISPNGTLSGLQQALAQPGVTTQVVALGVATDPCADSGYDPNTNSVVRIEQCDPANNPVLQIVQGGKQILMLRRLCGNAIGGTARLILNHPPTGSLTATCTATATSGTYAIRMTFNDPDGATTGQIRSNGGATLHSSNASPNTWTTPTTSVPPGDWPLHLYVNDVLPAGGGSGGYKNVATLAITSANCSPKGSISAVSCYQVSINLFDPNDPTDSIKYAFSINARMLTTPST